MFDTTPEHLHVMLNHLPLVGFAAGFLVLAVGGIMRHVAVMRTGLLVTLVFGLFTGLVMGTGEEAMERFEQGTVPNAQLDPVSMQLMEEHNDDAHLSGKIAYVATGLAGLGLVVSFIRRKWTLAATLIAIAAIVISGITLAQTARSGGVIRHPEFRTPDMVEQAETAAAAADGEESGSGEADGHEGDESGDAGESEEGGSS